MTFSIDERYKIQDTIAHWQLNEYTHMKPGLKRIEMFLEQHGNPQERFNSVLIAGTNGKGSTAEMLSEILSTAGYKTGLYTSPHLVNITERIRVGKDEIDESEFRLLSNRYIARAKACELTFFEFITALAFIHFRDSKVEIAVLEAGLGGRFDAVNVVKKPLVSVITDIGLDHCAVLGKTIREVAEEKMGITRRGMPVVTGALKRKALDVIKKHPGSMFLFGKDFIVEPETVDWEHGIQKFIFRGFGKNINIDLPLLGKAQLKNCSLAVSTAILLKRNGFQIDVGDIKAGLSNARWRGRFEVIKKRKSCFVVDGAHNPDAVENFIETYKNSPYNKKDTVFIFGILKDKDHLSVIKKLSKFVNKVILVEVGSKRALGLNEMAKEWSRYLPGERIHKANSLTDAMKTAKMHKVVVVTGSLYLTGEFLKNLYQTA